MDKITVEVVEAIDLIAMDSSGTSDPFCTIFVTSCNEHFKTKTVKKNLFPKWNEVFHFNGLSASDPTARLIVSIYDWDRFRTQDFILANKYMGQVFIPLAKMTPNVTHDEWYDLAPRKGKADKVKGKIHLKILISSTETTNSQIYALQKQKSRLSTGGNSADSPTRRRFSETVRTLVRESLSFQELQRQEVLLELIDSEQQYVDDLKIIVDVFMKPMAKNMLTKPEISAIFANIETIYNLHTEILQEFKDLQSANGVVTNIASVLAKHVDKFKFYAVYCSNQPTTLRKLKQYQEKSNSLLIFLEECLAKPECRRLDIGAFLIKPLQRLCKYPLLLRELNSKTSADHPEYEDLVEVHQQINDVVNSVNERTRQVERVQQMMDLSESFDNLQEKTSKDFEFVTHDRYFKRKIAVKLHEKKSLQGVDMELFLFSDLLILSKEGSKKRHARRVYSLRDLVVNEIEDGPDDFELIDTSSGKIDTITITADDKKEFLKDLENGISQYSIKRFLKDNGRRSMTNRDLSTNQKLHAIEKQLVSDAQTAMEQMEFQLHEAMRKNEELMEELNRWRENDSANNNNENSDESSPNSLGNSNSSSSFRDLLNNSGSRSRSGSRGSLSGPLLPRRASSATLEDNRSITAALRKELDEARRLAANEKVEREKLQQTNQILNNDLQLAQKEIAELKEAQSKLVHAAVQQELEKQSPRNETKESDVAATLISLKEENVKLLKEKEELAREVKKVYRSFRRVVRGLQQSQKDGSDEDD